MAADFARGSYVISGEAGVAHADTARIPGNVQAWNLGARFSLIPFGPTGSGIFHGAFEVGLEPYFQRYPTLAQNFAGLGLAMRYHLLGYGRIVPFIGGLAAAGGTDLKIDQLRSNFTFLLGVDVGAEYFVTDRFAPYLSFHFGHVSNADLQPPDLGFETYGIVAGVSYFIASGR